MCMLGKCNSDLRLVKFHVRFQHQHTIYIPRNFIYAELQFFFNLHEDLGFLLELLVYYKLLVQNCEGAFYVNNKSDYL